MSLKKFPIFTALNVIDMLLAGTALALSILRWKGFLKDCPSSSILIDAVYGACGFMIAIGLIGILATITRSKITIYFYKFLLFLAFLVASAFVAVTLMMKSGVANFILQFSWSQAPGDKICDFQKEFGCAGWSSTCVPYQSIDGCPSCSYDPTPSPSPTVFPNTTMVPVPTPSTLPTCKALFQHFFDDQFQWVMLGAGCFIGWVIILNIAAYCAGQQFTLFTIDDDEEYLIRRAERRRERERLLAEDQIRAERLNTPVNSAPWSEGSMRNMKSLRNQ